MTDLQAEATLDFLIAAVNDQLLREHVPYNVLRERVTFKSERELDGARGRLCFSITLTDSLELSLLHPWDDKDCPPQDLKYDVQNITAALGRFHEEQDGLLDCIAEMESAARKEVSRCRSIGLPVELVSVGLEPLHSWSRHEPQPIVTFKKLDDALQLAPYSFSTCDPEDLEGLFGDRHGPLAKLAGLRDEVTKAGAEGLIDLVALSALEDNGVDVYKEIARNRDFASVDAIEWSGGQIRTGFRDGYFTAVLTLTPRVEYNAGRIRLDVPDATPSNRKKQLVSAIAEHPYLPAGLSFADGEPKPGPSRYLGVKPELAFFSLAERRTWAR